ARTRRSVQVHSGVAVLRRPQRISAGSSLPGRDMCILAPGGALSTVVLCLAQYSAHRMSGRRQDRMDTSQLLKGVLDLAVLAVVAEEDAYGYDIVRRVRESGLDDVGDASVYGTLRRLFQAGALSSYVVPSDEGPHRKYYAV